MGWSENGERDRRIQQSIRERQVRQAREARSNWQTSQTKRELDMIGQQAAARKAAQAGSCMAARTTVALLGLAVIVLNGFGRQWDGPGSPAGPCSRIEGAPREAPGCSV